MDMLETFISWVTQAFNWIQPVWLILGALGVAALILLFGFILTLVTARKLKRRNSFLHVFRSRTRRNFIIILTLAFVIVSTLTILYMNYEGGIYPYLSIPALVVLWAFICEALFEMIDNLNRRRSGLKLCYCVCEDDDCTVDVEAITESRSEKVAERKPAPQKAASKPVAKHKVKKQAKKHSEQDVKRQEISEHLRRVEGVDRDRTESMEVETVDNSEEEELRRQRFEEERKNLAALARQAKSVQFADTRSTDRVIASKHSEASRSEATKQSTPVHKTVEVAKPAPKPVEVVRVVEQTRPVERTVETTVTRTAYQSQSVTSSDSKFNSLQAKLDVLKNDTATATAKTESSGKFNQTEVRSALDDLLKQMRSKRGEE